ncbi:hypothetical protein, conserved [Entamoeba dispar SAW760]|uniref:Uncharacterized protein n=1 Tax=Entamoeba dispar (strain ATCC PRA-260 / SAW760) TaxID=370354 RepID=B0EQD8_ENTDS|nr:uncharacterized protein EDI_122000 [Entamoeba dispar SAW760]EDR23263.1 hypothetical protein, conserved [Entamoeba dispar SAW760]|eukprot:EDR23263.1 hypothetical protein, conserved [Entamoeba dispar SAW760]
MKSHEIMIRCIEENPIKNINEIRFFLNNANLRDEEIEEILSLLTQMIMRVDKESLEYISLYIHLLMERLVTETKFVRNPIKHDGWKKLRIDPSFINCKILKMPVDIQIFLTEFIDKEEVIKRIKSNNIDILLKKRITSLIQWYPKEINCVESPDYMMIKDMIIKEKNNENYEINIKELYTVDGLDEMKLIALLLVYGIIHNKKIILEEMDHLIQHFVNRPLGIYFIKYFVQILRNYKEEICQKTIDFIVNGNSIKTIIYSLGENLIRLKLFNEKSIFYSIFQIFPKISIQETLKISQVIDFNDENIFSIQIRVINIFVLMIPEMIKISHEEMINIIQMVSQFIIKHQNIEIIQLFCDFIYASWKLIQQKGIYETIIYEVIIKITENILEGIIPLNDKNRKNLSNVYLLLFSEKHKYCKRILNIVINKCIEKNIDMEHIQYIFLGCYQSIKWSEKITHFCLEELIEKKEIKEENIKRSIMLLRLLKTGINKEMIIKNEEIYYQLFNLFIKYDILKSVIDEVKGIFIDRLIYSYNKDKNDQKLIEIFHRYIKYCIISHLDCLYNFVINSYIDKEQKISIYQEVQKTKIDQTILYFMNKYFKDELKILIEQMKIIGIKLSTMKQEEKLQELYYDVVEKCIKKNPINTIIDEENMLIDNEMYNIINKDIISIRLNEMNEEIEGLDKIFEIYLILSKELNRPIINKSLLTIKQKKLNSIPIEYFIGGNIFNNSIDYLIQKIEEIDIKKIIYLMKKDTLGMMDETSMIETLLKSLNNQYICSNLTNGFKVFNQLIRFIPLTFNNINQLFNSINQYCKTKKELLIDENIYQFIDYSLQLNKETSAAVSFILLMIISLIINSIEKQPYSKIINNDRNKFIKENNEFKNIIYCGYNDVFDSFKIKIIDNEIHNNQIKEILQRNCTLQMLEKCIETPFIYDYSKPIPLKQNIFIILYHFFTFKEVKNIIEVITNKYETENKGKFYILQGLIAGIKSFKIEDRLECQEYILKHCIDWLQVINSNQEYLINNFIKNDYILLKEIYSKCIKSIIKGNYNKTIILFIIKYSFYNISLIETTINTLFNGTTICGCYKEEISKFIHLLINDKRFNKTITNLLIQILKNNNKPTFNNTLNANISVIFNSIEIINNNTIELCIEIIYILITLYPFDNFKILKPIIIVKKEIQSQFVEKIQEIYFNSDKNGKMLILDILCSMNNLDLINQFDFNKMMNTNNFTINSRCSDLITYYIKKTNNIEFCEKIIEKQLNNNIINEHLYITALSCIILSRSLFINNSIKNAVHQLLHFKPKNSQIKKYSNNTLMIFRRKFNQLLKYDKNIFSEDDMELLYLQSIPWYMA